MTAPHLLAPLFAVICAAGWDQAMDQERAGPVFVPRYQPGHPFSAEFEERRRSAGGKEEVERARLYVDGATRVRQEYVLDGWVAQIIDPVAGISGMVDLASGKLLARWDEPMAAQARSPASTGRNPGPAILSTDLEQPEDLGSEAVEGLACRGYRLRNARTRDVYEVWWSVELGVIVRHRRLNAAGNEDRLVRLVTLQRGEPDPRLFDIPVNASRNTVLPRVTAIWKSIRRR